MENAQIQSGNTKCIECGEGITNPICPDCLAKEMICWNPDLDKILVTPSSDDGDVKCIICGSRMSICAHCYSRDVHDFIAENDPDKREEFIDTFNYGLREELT